MGFVSMWRRCIVRPVFQNRHHIFPSGFEFVTTVEQSEFAVNHPAADAHKPRRGGLYGCTKSTPIGVTSTLLPAPGFHLV